MTKILYFIFILLSNSCIIELKLYSTRLSEFLNYRHGKNRTIVRKGDPGRHYYFIYSGQVELKDSAVDSSVKLPTLGPGKDFGVSGTRIEAPE